MAHPEIEFCIIRDDKEKIVGFSLVAESQTEAEYFCAKFPKALAEERAKIWFKKGTILFEDPEEGTSSFEIGEKDAKILKDFIEVKGEYKGSRYGLYLDGFLAPGFKLTLEGMRDSNKRDPIIRSNR